MSVLQWNLYSRDGRYLGSAPIEAIRVPGFNVNSGGSNMATKKAAKKDLKKSGKNGKAKTKAAKKEAKIKPEKPPRVCVTQDAKRLPEEIKHFAKDERFDLKAMKAECQKTPKTSRSKWCGNCYRKHVRPAQLRVNNVTWDQRVEKGVAGHHSKYKGKPTAFVQKAQKAGVPLDKVIKQGGVGEKVVIPEKLLKKIESVQLAPKVEGGKKFRKGREKKAPPTAEQKRIAQGVRESLKRDKANGKVADKKPAPLKMVKHKGGDALVMPTPVKETKADKDLAKVARAVNSGDDEKIKKAAAKVATEKPQTEVVLGGSTGKPQLRAVKPQGKEIEAQAATPNHDYEVGGSRTRYIGKEDDKHLFQPLDDLKAKPYKLTSSTPITPLG